MSQHQGSEPPKRKRHGASIMAWLLVAVMAGSLTGYGISGYGLTANNIGMVGDQPIQVQTYANVLQNQLRSLSAQTGGAFGPAQAKAMGLDAQVRRQLIEVAAFDYETRRLGLSVGDGAVFEQIQQIPAFGGLSGRFDAQSYRTVLKENGQTPEQFEAGVRRDLARNLLQDAVAEGFLAPKSLGNTLYDYMEQRRSFRFLPLQPNDDVAPAMPDEAALKAYYDRHPAEFTKPEAKRISYALLLPEELATAMPVDEAELRKLYDQNKDEYIKPERRLVERLVFPNMTEAEAAKQQLDGGKDFAVLVEERGLKPGDIDLGDVTHSELGAAGDGVFALTAPGVVGPFDTALGPALFRMNAVLAAQEVTFDQVKQDLTVQYQQDAARRAIADKKEAIDDALAAGDGLDILEKTYGMKKGVIDFSVKSDDKIAAYPAFRQAAQRMQAGDFAELITLDDGGVIAMQVDEIVPSAPTAFEEARPAVEAAVQKDMQHKALVAQATEIKEKLAGGAQLKDFGSVQEVALATRRMPPQNIAPAVMAAVFKLQKGDAQVIEAADHVGIVQLDDIQPPAPDTAGDRQMLVDQLQRSIGQDALDLLGTALMEEAGVSLDQSVIEAVHAQIGM